MAENDKHNAPVNTRGKSGIDAGNGNGKRFPVDIYDYLFLILIVVTAFTRFYNLDTKAFHHDESLYGRYCYNFANGQGHRYDPLMHGPFLFIANGSLMYLIGSSDTIVRSPAAVFGILLVGLCYFLRPVFGRKGAFLLALYFTFSPSITYFSRFLRMDIFVLVFSFATIVFFLRFLKSGEGKYLYISIFSLALFFCTKENSFLHTFEFMTFFVLAALIPILRHEEGHTFGNLITQIKTLFWENRYKIIIAFSLFWIIFILFYTTFFTNPRGFVDGLGRKAIPYWIHQNKIQRVRGEYHYHLTRMLMYELPLFIGFVISCASVFWKRKNHFLIALSISIFTLGLFFQWGHLPLPVYKIVGEHSRIDQLTPEQQQQYGNVGVIAKLLNMLHLECYGHVFLFLYVVIMGFWLTFTLIDRKQYLSSFFIYTSMFYFLMYSYLGEKVAWLSIHIYLPMAMTVAYFGAKVEKTYHVMFYFLVGILTVYAAYCSYGLNYYNNGINEDNPYEIICYTQTHADMKKLIKKVEQLGDSTGLKERIPIFLRGESAWPMMWYWRDYKAIHWAGETGVPDVNRPVVIMDWEDRHNFDYILGEDFKMERYKLRAWDVMPNLDRSNIPWSRYISYLFKRLDRFPLFSPGVGSTDIAVFFREDVLEGKYQAKYSTGEPSKRVSPSEKEVRKITIPGFITWGGAGQTQGYLNEPRDIAVSLKGEVYVADTMNHRIQKFDENGKFINVWGTKGNAAGQFNTPSGIAVDSEGNLYVSDTWNHRIQKFTSDGKFIKMWGVPGPGNTDMEFWAPKGIAIDQQDSIFVVNTGCHKINKFTADGAVIRSWGFKTPEDNRTPGGFLEPVGIAVDDMNQVYVCDTNNRRVQIFNQDGKFLRDFGTLGWQDFYTEPYICLNSRKHVFVSDSVNNRIQLYDNEGKLIAVWGGQAGNSSGEFNAPKGLAYSNGFIYVVDSRNNRIQKFAETDLGL